MLVRLRERVQSLLGVRAGEWKRLMQFMALFLVINTVVDCADVIATSDYVSRLGTDSIPLVWGAQMVLLLVLSTLYAATADRYRHDSVLRALLMLFGVVFVAVRVLVGALSYPER